MIRDLKLYYTNALFVVTGAIPYYLFGALPGSIIIRHFCGPESPSPEGPCLSLLITLSVIAILGMPIACAQFHKTGKWLWTDVLHVFAPAS